MIKKSVGAVLTTTLTDIYTVPSSKKSEWVMLYITNTSGNTQSFDVAYYDASEATTFPIFDAYSISGKEFFQIGGNYNQFIYMQAGDKIKASATGSMTLLVSLIEHNDVIQGG